MKTINMPMMSYTIHLSAVLLLIANYFTKLTCFSQNEILLWRNSGQ